MTEDQQMNDVVEVVEVTQADRELFCALFRVPGPRTNGVLNGDCDGREEMQALAMHRIAHSPGDGMVVVPRVITNRMLDAWSEHAHYSDDEDIKRGYAAMIAAAGQGD